MENALDSTNILLINKQHTYPDPLTTLGNTKGPAQLTSRREIYAHLRGAAAQVCSIQQLAIFLFLSLLLLHLIAARSFRPPARPAPSAPAQAHVHAHPVRLGQIHVSGGGAGGRERVSVCADGRQLATRCSLPLRSSLLLSTATQAKPAGPASRAPAKQAYH